MADARRVDMAKELAGLYVQRVRLDHQIQELEVRAYLAGVVVPRPGELPGSYPELEYGGNVIELRRVFDD